MQRSSTQVIVLLAVFAGSTAVPASLASQTTGDYISGRVVSEDAVPEAGVWVIAESKDVMANDGRGPDSYRKIVVTDDAGRFLLPDLPSGTYDVWVRGYGLVDSRASWTLSGQHLVRPGTRDLQITVETAQTPQQAARVYPANYWYSLLKLPPATAFPRRRQLHPQRCGVSERMVRRAQAELQPLSPDRHLCDATGNPRGVGHRHEEVSEHVRRSELIRI